MHKGLSGADPTSPPFQPDAASAGLTRPEAEGPRHGPVGSFGMTAENSVSEVRWAKQEEKLGSGVWPGRSAFQCVFRAGAFVRGLQSEGKAWPLADGAPDVTRDKDVVLQPRRCDRLPASS